jgi:flagella basal body P-ring formation protein FlgA
VTAAAQSIGGHELAEAAGLTIKKEFEKDPDFEVQTDAGNLPPDMIVRPGPYELQCDLPDGGVHPGYQTLRVHIIQNGKRVAESSCSMTARVTCTVAVATERIAGGEILEAGSFKSIRREVSAAELKERCNAEKLCGLRAKQSIGADQLLTKSQFALPLVIRRGESVRILVRRGTLELTAVGQARNDASVDEPVRVFVNDSGAEIVARTSGLREACLDDPLADSRKNLETHR